MKTRDLCQDCWQDVHPTDYAPTMTREGECVRCGSVALIGRSTIADESPAAISAWATRTHEDGSTFSASPATHARYAASIDIVDDEVFLDDPEDEIARLNARLAPGALDWMPTVERSLERRAIRARLAEIASDRR